MRKRILQFLLLYVSTLTPAYAGNGIPELLKFINDTVTQAESIELAILEVASYEEVIKNQFHKNTIAGYPVKVQLGKTARSKIEKTMSIILDGNNYADSLRRCKNSSLYGIRFRKVLNSAEFAFGQPCMQAFWLAKVNNKIVKAGGVLGPDAGRTILELFK